MVSNSIPDKLAVITYVSQLHSYFNDLPKSVRARRRTQSQKAKMKPSGNAPVAKPKPKKKSSLLAPPPRHTELEPKFHQFHAASSGTLQRQRTCSAETTTESHCCQCHKDVFLMERIVAERKLFHRACFRCAKCAAVLKLRTYKYVPQDEKFYCNEHYSVVKQALQKPSSPKIQRKTPVTQQKRRFSLEKKRAIALQSFQKSFSAPHSPHDTSKTMSLPDINEVSSRLEAIPKGKYLAKHKPGIRAKTENIPETMEMEIDDSVDNEKWKQNELPRISVDTDKLKGKENTFLARENTSPSIMRGSLSPVESMSSVNIPDGKLPSDKSKESIENTIPTNNVETIMDNKENASVENKKQIKESDQEPPCKKQNFHEEKVVEKRLSDVLYSPRRKSSGTGINPPNITEEQVSIFRDSRKGSRPSVRELAQKFLKSENDPPVKKREFNHFSKVVAAAREMRADSGSDRDADTGSPKPKGSLIKEIQSKYISRVEKSEEMSLSKTRSNHPLFRIISVDGHRSSIDQSSYSSSETITSNIKDLNENITTSYPESTSTSSVSSHSTLFNSNPDENAAHSRPASECSSVDDDSMSSTSERMSVIIGQEPSAVSIRSRMFFIEFAGDGSMPPERVFRDYTVLDGQEQDAHLTGSESRYMDIDAENNQNNHLTADGGTLQKVQERKLSADQIEDALVKIEEKHSTLQRKGVEMEKVLQSMDDAKSASQIHGDGEMLKKWLELVHEKNVLLRKESELVYLDQQRKYEDRQKQIENELRTLVEMRDEVKSKEQKQKEESLMNELLFVIDKRNCLIEQLEEERRKEHDEDTRIQELKHKKGSAPGPAVRPKSTKSKHRKF